ncbi:hypothetical protein, partial [Shewanella algae]|uniref:hypothetical protein n=1 Tax=Shewanella algae TaxID=38313 RepID=UPI00313BFB6D
MLDYEWQIWRIGVGKIGLTAGLGIFTSQGHGHFAHPSLNPGLTPLETFTFLAMPVTVGAVYRLHIWDRQLFVPFGSGGIEG